MTFVHVLFMFSVALFVEIMISQGNPTAPGFISCLVGVFFGYSLVEKLFP